MRMEELLALLDGVRKSGSGWLARCPGHRDRKASLSVTEKGDRVLLHCHAGCSSDAIVGALGLSMADLFAEPHPSLREATIYYEYQGPGGVPVFRVCRGPEKRFWQERPDGRGGWLRGAPPPEARVLYRLPEVFRAAGQGGPVLIVEGEKDVETLRTLRLVATTAAMGAGRWLPHYSETLCGARVYILADNDPPGIEHARAVADALLGIAREVRQVLLPGLPPKGDVSDWLAAGGDRPTLARLCKAAPLHSRGARLQRSPSEAPEAHLTVAAEPSPSGASDGATLPAMDLYPSLDDEALSGYAGQIVRTLEPHVESDSAALLVQLLVGFGSAVGRRPYWRHDRANRHYLNEFALMVGSTASGRKGTSLHQILSLLREADPDWAAQCVLRGLSSGEGLIVRVRDPGLPRDDGTQGEPGISDKRALAIEAEFGAVLGRGKREGNTLSHILRDAWDGSPLQTLTRKDPLRSTDAHISVIGHITPGELRALISSQEVTNGFLNRFLIVCVRRARSLPFGGTLSDAAWQGIGQEIGRRLTRARSVSEMILDGQAADYWARLYDALEPRGFGAVAAATGRAAPHVRRLACLYALLDAEAVVRLSHLRAAVALWRYCEASTAYILGEAFGDPITQRVADLLQAAGPEGLKLANIHAGLGNHARGAALRNSLVELEAARRIERLRPEPSTSRVRGRPEQRFRWVAAVESSPAVSRGELSELSEEIPLVAPPTGITSLYSLNSHGGASGSPLVEVEI